MFTVMKYRITARSILWREWLLTIKGKGQWLNPLIFFVMVTSLFPLSTMGHESVYIMIAPSIIWVAFLLSALLSLETSYRSDFQMGVFDQWVLSPQPLWLMLFFKGLAHFVINLLPMILLMPLVAYGLHLPPESWKVLIVSLLLGAPVISFLGMIGVCLTLNLKNSGLLLSLILLPLFMPVLVFGAGALSTHLNGLSPAGHLAILGALLAATISLAPIGAAFSLRISLL